MSFSCFEYGREYEMNTTEGFLVLSCARQLEFFGGNMIHKSESYKVVGWRKMQRFECQVLSLFKKDNGL